MNILFVSQYFYPENFRINDLALRLLKRGHRVSVLTGMPNYPQGEFYKGYGPFSPKEEDYQGVRVMRVPVIPRHTGAAWLCLNYLSFIISGCRKAGLLREEYDVIYAFGTSPITQVLPALTYKRRHSAGIIVNVQDLWPDNVSAITGIHNPLAIGLLDIMVDYIYNRCDIIMGTSKSFVQAIRKRRGLRDKRKVVYYPQYAVVEASQAKRYDLMPERELFHIAFTGNVGEGQGLDKLIGALVLLKKQGYEGRVIFEIFGDGRSREELEKQRLKCGLERMLRFHGSFPEEEIPAILNTADAALLILKYDPIFKRTIPAKLQTYLACGCLVLGCVEGEGKALIRREHIGISADCINHVALANATKELLELPEEEISRMRGNALALSRREFDPELLVERLEKYMRYLHRQKKRGRIC